MQIQLNNNGAIQKIANDTKNKTLDFLYFRYGIDMVPENAELQKISTK